MSSQFQNIDGLFVHTLHRDDFLVRSCALRGARRTVVWDTLTRPQDMEPVVYACDGQVPLIVYSHADWDHIWGTAAFDPGAFVVAQRACLARFQSDVPQTLREFQAAQPGQWDDVRLVPPTVTFDQRLDVDLGAVTLELHNLPGHTADALVGFVPQWGLLLAGDSVELPCPCVPRGANLSHWIDRLVFWRDHPDLRVVLPSHGPCGGADLLARNIAYLHGLLIGQPVAMSVNLPDFYRRTHQDNLRHCGL